MWFRHDCGPPWGVQGVERLAGRRKRREADGQRMAAQLLFVPTACRTQRRPQEADGSARCLIGMNPARHQRQD